ncbi:hypothetical protein EV126DRAFT_109038 [Verticillium dahliae]|nr:hypothetical protein EV126DRAFT_109038 [Verticillium dahliae]
MAGPGAGSYLSAFTFGYTGGSRLLRFFSLSLCLFLSFPFGFSHLNKRNTQQCGPPPLLGFSPRQQKPTSIPLQLWSFRLVWLLLLFYFPRLPFVPPLFLFIGTERLSWRYPPLQHTTIDCACCAVGSQDDSTAAAPRCPSLLPRPLSNLF